ncbi:unnamed protein product, partial [Linum tenue]
ILTRITWPGALVSYKNPKSLFFPSDFSIASQSSNKQLDSWISLALPICNNASQTRNQEETCSKIGESEICRSASFRAMDPSQFVFRNCVYLELSVT